MASTKDEYQALKEGRHIRRRFLILWLPQLFAARYKKHKVVSFRARAPGHAPHLYGFSIPMRWGWVGLYGAGGVARYNRAL